MTLPIDLSSIPVYNITADTCPENLPDSYVFFDDLALSTAFAGGNKALGSALYNLMKEADFTAAQNFVAETLSATLPQSTKIDPKQIKAITQNDGNNITALPADLAEQLGFGAPKLRPTPLTARIMPNHNLATPTDDVAINVEELAKRLFTNEADFNASTRDVLSLKQRSSDEIGNETALKTVQDWLKKVITQFSSSPSEELTAQLDNTKLVKEGHHIYLVMPRELAESLSEIIHIPQHSAFLPNSPELSAKVSKATYDGPADSIGKGFANPTIANF